MHAMRLAAGVMTALLWIRCGTGVATATETVAVPPPTLLASDTEQVTATIRALEAKVRQHPEDFIAYTKLAGYYLQRQRLAGQTVDTQTRLAHSALLHGRPEEAKQYLTQALTLSPEFDP